MKSNENVARLALLNANRGGKEAILKEIIESGNINYQVPSKSISESITKDLEGCTALHIAVKNEDLDSIKILLKNGADITIKDYQGMTALHRAIEFERNSIGSFIYKLRGSLKDSVIELLLSAHIDYDKTKNPRNKNGLSHLHAACITNNVEAVKFFLKNEASVDETVFLNSPILPGYTALHIAARYSSAEVATILLDHGAEPNTKDAQAMTPLHMLIQRNMEIADWMNMGKRARCGQLQEEYMRNESIIKAILEKTYEEIIDDTGLSCLHVACILKDTSILKMILEETTEINDTVDENSSLWPGYSALHFAAHFNVQAVVLLMNRGGNMLTRAVNKFTPLDLCLQRYKTGVIYNLIDLKPDWRDIRFFDGRTKLLDFIDAMKDANEFRSFVGNCIRHIDTLIPYDSPILPAYTILHFVVVIGGRTKHIDDLLKDTLYAKQNDEADIYNCDEKEEKLYLERIETCLIKSPDFRVKDFYQSTALHLAFELQRDDAAKAIAKKYGHTDPCGMSNCMDKDGLSQFEIACAAGVKKLAKGLLHQVRQKFGGNGTLAKTYNYSRFGHTVIFNAGSNGLHLAVVTQKVSLVKFLLMKNFDICAQDKKGMTPIHRSIVSQEICDILLKSKIDDLQDCVADCGLSHLHVACVMKNVEAVKALLQNGAKVNSKVSMDYEEYPSIRGLSSLQIAVRDKNKEIVTLLIRAGANIFVGSREFLEELYQDYSDLFFEALEGHVAKGKPVEEHQTLTELHVACFAIDVKRVDKLLKNKADPNARVHPSNPIWSNYTPLHVLAAEFTRKRAMVVPATAIVSMLIEHGADMTLTNNDNDTALHLAFDHVFKIDEKDEKIPASKALKTWKKIPKRLDALLKAPPADEKIQLEYGWNYEDKSKNIHLKNPLTICRKVVGYSTDGIRGKQGFTKGLHVWEIYWSKEHRGTHAVIGVATSEAPLHTKDYTNLIGSNESSWGWDIVNNTLLHVPKQSNDRDKYLGYLEPPVQDTLVYPIYNYLPVEKSVDGDVVPDKIKVILDMDEGTLAFMVNDKYLDIAFEGLEGKRIYPAVSAVRAAAEVNIKYIGGIEDGNRFGIKSHVGIQLNTMYIINSVYRGEFLNSLLKKYRDFFINPMNNKGISVFHIACWCENIQAVKEFLKHGINVDRPIDYFCDTYAGYAPIHLAALHKRTETLDLLIEYGADINARNREGNTPMHLAADYSDYPRHVQFGEEASEDCMVSLFRAGATITAKNRLNQTPFDVLMKTKGLSTKTAEIFLKNPSHVNIFNESNEGFIATVISCESTIENILKNTAYKAVVEHPQLNGTDSEGRTPIHNIVAFKRSDEKSCLTARSYLEAIEGLTRLNFDIDTYDHEGRTPLHYAVKFQNLLAICALLDLGADFNIVDIDGETPYTLALKLKKEKSCDHKVLEIFAKHMYKLTMADLNVSEITEEVNENANGYVTVQFFKTILNDLENLKKYKVGTWGFSLREFLSNEKIYEKMDKETRESFDELFRVGNKKLAIDYPEWVGILRMQYRKIHAKTVLPSVTEESSVMSSLYSYFSWA